MPFPQTVHFVFLSFGCDPGEHLAHSPVVPALPGGQSSQVLWSMCGCLPAAQAVHDTPSVPANTAASQEKPRWEERREGQSHRAALLGTDRSRWGQYCFHLLADQGCGRQRLATEAKLGLRRGAWSALSVCRHLARSAHGTHALPQLRGRFPIGTGQTAVPVLRRLFPVHT